MFEPVATAADARDALLATVDFKWLMTGQGWWVDSARFYADPSYARDMLQLAKASTSSALRECAAELERCMDRRSDSEDCAA